MLRFAFLALAVLLPCSAMAADKVPLPKPRPHLASWQLVGAPIFVAADLMSEPSACQIKLQTIAHIEAITLLNGSNECGGDDMVRLKSVIMPDKSKVEISPPAQVRCKMAEQLANFVRDDLAPEFKDVKIGTLVNYDAYECRPRNRVMGGKLSEHSKGNALDVRSIKLIDGKIIDPTDMQVDRSLRETIKAKACARFTTVLGPGSDGHHESHIHLDIAERRSMFSGICRWVVRDPPPKVVPLPAPKPDEQADPDVEADAPNPGEPVPVADVPLPRPRPRLARAGNPNGRL